MKKKKPATCGYEGCRKPPRKGKTAKGDTFTHERCAAHKGKHAVKRKRERGPNKRAVQRVKTKRAKRANRKRVVKRARKRAVKRVKKTTKR